MAIRFMYDEKTLSFAMEKSGFVELRRCSILRSAVAELSQLENVNRMPAGFLEQESLIMEGQKPKT